MKNQHNERVKYNYRLYLSKVKKRDKKTWMAAMQHIHQFECFTESADFTNLNEHIISSYIDQLVANNSLSYAEHNIKFLRDFYIWLERQKGYKSKINYNLLGYFQLTTNQRNTARSPEYQENYELKEIRTAIAKMPNNTISDMRDRAIISLQALCGLRISELRTIKMKNVIFDKPTDRWIIYVNPKDMSVKFAKTRRAFFMPFDVEWQDNVMRWRDKLLELGFEEKDPFFPIITNQFGQNNLLDRKIHKVEIKGNGTIIKVFQRAFRTVGLPYLRPHSFRHSIVRWAESQSPEVFNAVRQSLGHSDIKTTFQSYGEFSPTKIGQILNSI